MTFKEELADANAKRAHLLDNLSMDDEYAKKAMQRAAVYTAVGASLVIAIAITYQIRKHHGD